MATRLHLSVSDELFGRVEVARGDVPRSVWVRRALEAALSRDPRVVPAASLRAPGSASGDPTADGVGAKPPASAGLLERTEGAAVRAGGSRYGPRRPRPKGIA